MSDAALFAVIRDIVGRGLTQAEVDRINGALRPVASASPLTVRAACEIIGHEAIVQEAYKDSVGVWTWSIGLTAKAGIKIEQFIDNPQPIERCVKAYIDILRTSYIPDVLAAFPGRTLTEEEFTAALSFHYNTGAIKRADWVKSWLAGNTDRAFQEFMNWCSPKEIIPRREKERALFFKGAWTGGTKMATVYPVRKPQYTPDWGKAQRVPIEETVTAALKA